MPKIISSTSLASEYNDVSAWCHETSEPAFVTRNGAGDLAVMSMGAYDCLVARASRYDKLLEGRADVRRGRMRDANEVVKDMWARLS